MFVISGYKFITSDNPEDRTEAKKGFMFVILALIIIIIAEPLVNLLIGPAQPESAKGVIFYEDSDFKGRYGEIFIESDRDLKDNIIGKHSPTAPYPHIFNDMPHSLLIVGSCDVTLYEDTQLQGTSYSVSSSTANLRTFIGHECTIKSINVNCT